MKSMHPTGLGRSALQAYRLLLNEGGWWTLREIGFAREVFVSQSLRQVINGLVTEQHVEQRGSGIPSDPYRYGVTAKCKPVPYVTLDVAPNAEPKPAQPLRRPATHPYFYN